MSRGALGSEHVSQFSTNQSIVAEFKGLIGLEDLPGSVGSSFNYVLICNEEFKCAGCAHCVPVKTKLSRVLIQKAIF